LRRLRATRSYPLDPATDAHADLDSGGAGNVVVDIRTCEGNTP
jgi:hypothetical protein